MKENKLLQNESHRQKRARNKTELKIKHSNKAGL